MILAINGGRIWAGSLDFPDTNTLGRTWVTEITVAEQAAQVHSGARLINVNAIKGYPAYAAMYRGEKVWCEHHVKYGGGIDPRRMFRIYYYWHEDDQLLVIGHIPTHLDNSLTN